jgi:hypothetical protein
LRILSGAAVAAVLLLGAPVALAHEGNPNYRSEVRSITPHVPGVTAGVLNFDDRVELQNASDRTIVIEDYKGRPYARLRPDRTVEVNTNSEAYYLNDDRFAQVQVPDGLPAQPKWKLVSRTGRFEWHDHRAHWMSKTRPPQVTDPDERTHILDWTIPIRVGDERGTIAGSLTWVPLPGGSLPMGLIWGSAAVLIALSLFVFLVRRRRSAGEQAPAAAPSTEAW